MRVAFDEAGNPTKAALGFARGQGVAVEDLEKRETDSGVYLYAVKELPGESTEKILPELLPKLLESLSFPSDHALGRQNREVCKASEVACGTVGEQKWWTLPGQGWQAADSALATASGAQAPSALNMPRITWTNSGQITCWQIRSPGAREIEEGLLTKAQELGGKVLLDQGAFGRSEQPG